MNLHTIGTKIVNESGKEVRLCGVNCAGLEWDAGNETVLPALLLAADEWKANIIRLPVSQDRWFGWGPEQISGRVSPGRCRELVDIAVRELAERDCCLILDLHWSDRGDRNEKSGQQIMPDRNSVLFWEDAAARYKDCGNVLFGLYNEPHDVDWDLWLNGGVVETDGKAWEAVGMRTLLRAIRSKGAENLCVIGGLDWGYTFRGFADYDALLETGGNLVLDTHIYPWKPLDWDADVGEAASRCPLLVGECGHYGDDAHPREGKQCLPAAEWVPRLLSWIDEKNCHLTAWDFHPHAGPCLISDFQGTPTPWYGAAVRDYLLKHNGV
ncbi:MAG: cellulase family glycosylhydrolase [Clostridia bacterium]|nr:cellulase family glycosylhydrolase [Clostridia bacterium]